MVIISIIASAVAIVLLASFIYVLLCGQAECHRGGIVRKANNYLLHGIWSHLRSLLPKSMKKNIDSMQDFCCSKANPLFQILYVGLIGGGFILFLFSGWDLIPGPHLHFWHKYTACISVFGTIGVFFYCVRANPGIITKDTIHLHKDNYPIDHVLYEKKFCKTCNVDRPARSKHCKVCGVCVARFDHHCVWISNCVGEGNQRKFVAMLISTAMLCTYTAWGIAMMLWGILEEHNLIGAMVKNRRTGEIIPMPYSILLTYMVRYGGFLITLFILAFVMGIVLYIFAGYHIYLIARNTTTSETFKWGDVKSDVKAAKKIHSIIEKRKRERKDKGKKEKGGGGSVLREGETYIDLFGKKASMGIRRKIFYKTGIDVYGYETIPEDMEPKPLSGKEADAAFIEEIERLLSISLSNTYNRGIINNFKEVLFPAFERKQTEKKNSKKKKQ